MDDVKRIRRERMSEEKKMKVIEEKREMKKEN